MKIALPWLSDQNFDSLAQEHNITFENKLDNFDHLLNFLEEHKNERFNISIDFSKYDFDLEKMRFAKIVNPNIHIVLIDYQPKNIQILKENKINFYFSSFFAANSFRVLENLVNIGATDVYIIDDLCYQLSDVHKFCQQHHVQCRLILDQIASHQNYTENNLRAPYFVPEIIDELSQYIDVFEFAENESKKRLQTLYQIWFEKKTWRENLKYLYPQLQLDIPNQSLISDFIKYKMNCRYKCSYGSACKKCNQFADIAHILFDKQIEYVLPKKEG